MKILHGLSFFFTNVTGAHHNDTLGCISPRSINSNCIFNSCNSGVDIWYCILAIGFVPGFKSMVNSNYISGGKPGNSLGNTLANSDNTWIFYNPSVSPFSLSVKITYNLHPLCILFVIVRKKQTSMTLPHFFLQLVYSIPNHLSKLTISSCS